MMRLTALALGGQDTRQLGQGCVLALSRSCRHGDARMEGYGRARREARLCLPRLRPHNTHGRGVHRIPSSVAGPEAHTFTQGRSGRLYLAYLVPWVGGPWLCLTLVHVA